MKILKLIKKFFARCGQGVKNLLLLSRKKNLRPRWIWFGATDLCNSRCTHCQIWKKQVDVQQELTLADLEKVFSDPLLSDVEAIVNSGGEALLRPDIIDLIKLENKFFPKAILDLSTNGLLPDRALNVVKELLSAGIKISVGVSLDGLREEHDQIRGVPGNFEKVNYLLDELVKLRSQYPELLYLIVGFTLSDITLNRWQAVNDYCASKGVEFSMQWYNQSSFYENQTRDHETNKSAMILAVKAQPLTMIRQKWLRWLAGKSIKFQCFAGQTFFVLRPDGKVSPCLTYWDDLLGNVKNQTPTEIWQSATADEVRKKVKQCPGCINSWAVEWSASTTFFPRLKFYLKNPLAIFDRLKRRD